MRILHRSGWYIMSASILKVLVEGLSHNLEIRIGREVTAGSIEVTSSDEGKGAFEADEHHDKDNVDANGADEHDKIEDCHE
jgi:hypothetical protein